MEIRSNSRLSQVQIGQEAIKTEIQTVANGVSQATPAGIAAAKDAFQNAPILGQLPSQVSYKGIPPPAHQLSPADYLQQFKNNGIVTESMKQVGSLPSGFGEPKVFEGISQKLSRERLDSISDQSESQNFGEQNKKAMDWGKLLDCGRILNMINSIQDMSKNAAQKIKA